MFEREKVRRLKKIKVGDIIGYTKLMDPFYEKDKSGKADYAFSNVILGMESSIPGYLFEFNNQSADALEMDNEHQLIKKLIRMARNEFQNMYGRDPINGPMSRECVKITAILEKLCEELNIKYCSFNFLNSIMDHTAIVIFLNSGNDYLIDLSYQQFFLLGNNLSNRHITTFPDIIGRPVIQGPYVGYQMVNSGNKETAKNILQNGYTPIDDEFKFYANGFFNALYTQEGRDRFMLLSTGELMDMIKKQGYINDKYR